MYRELGHVSVIPFTRFEKEECSGFKAKENESLPNK